MGAFWSCWETVWSQAGSVQAGSVQAVRGGRVRAAQTCGPQAQGSFSHSQLVQHSHPMLLQAVLGRWLRRGPLSALLMPLLGAVAAFGLARSGALFLRAVIGMALGFAYFVADNFALAMGNLGAYPPFIAAWAPFLLFLLIGETVLVRTEE